MIVLPHQFIWISINLIYASMIIVFNRKKMDMSFWRKLTYKYDNYRNLVSKWWNSTVVMTCIPI
jgi:hypothetical protein